MIYSSAEMRRLATIFATIFATFICTLSSLYLSGCQSCSTEPSESPLSEAPSSSDSRGAQDKPREASLRVLSLAPSHTEWVFKLGAQEHLVGRTDHCDHPAGARDIPSIGNLFPPNIERLLSRTPTDVLMIDGHEALGEHLQRLGVRVHRLQPHSLNEIFTLVKQLGSLLNASNAAHAWVSESEMRVSRLKAPQQRPRVLIEVWSKPLTVAGAESFMGDLVRVAGGESVPRDLGAWPTLSLERLIALDPEVLLVSTEALYRELTQHPKPPWSALSAVKSGRVYLLGGRLARPGPRVIDELEWLHQRITPRVSR